MKNLLILAYMGTGKTELEKRYEDVVDFDFQDYKYIYDESIRHLPLEQSYIFRRNIDERNNSI